MPDDIPARASDRRDCAHPGRRHRHGTRAAHAGDGCRCQDCRAAVRAHARGRRRAIAYGRWAPFVDAEPTRTHLRNLRAAGVGVNQIIARSGVGSGTVRQLIYGYPRTGRPVGKIRPDTAARLLAVDPTDLAAGARVDAAATTRRLQALIAVGWTVPTLSRHLGRTPRALTHTLTQRHVTAATAAAVRALCARLEATPPPQRTPAERRSVADARAYAVSRGWHAQLAWDDIDAGILGADQPTPPRGRRTGEPVDEIAVERAVFGDTVDLHPVERDEVIRRLTARGSSLRQIARRVGVSHRTVGRRRHAHPAT